MSRVSLMNGLNLYSYDLINTDKDEEKKRHFLNLRNPNDPTVDLDDGDSEYDSNDENNWRNDYPDEDDNFVTGYDYFYNVDRSHYDNYYWPDHIWGDDDELYDYFFDEDDEDENFVDWASGKLEQLKFNEENNDDD